MKEHPIIFNTDMVKAILEGRKTMTRRLNALEKINDNPVNWIVKMENIEAHFYNSNTDKNKEIKCPYGQPGDLLWVRETWKKSDFPEADGPFEYKASVDYDTAWNRGIWRPSIHMPKSAARIWLRITDIRVERLQDITGEDAAKEGTDWTPPLVTPEECSETERNLVYKHSFERLWNSIHGWCAWDKNPWVWVVSFEDISSFINHKS